MAIDHYKSKPHTTSSHRKAPKSQNYYLNSLVKLFTYLSRRTGAAFNKVILRQLFLSRANRQPVSVAKIDRALKHEGVDKTVVVVGTVTSDNRLHSFPKASVAALRFTAGARDIITKNGGEAITLDQLAARTPTGSNTIILRGPKKAREAYRHFGMGPHQHKAPKLVTKGRKFESARGRRRSRGFKV